MTSYFSSKRKRPADDDISLVNILESMSMNNPCTMNVVVAMLEQGADVNVRDPDGGRTPLIVAAGMEGSIPILQVLLDHGAGLCDQDNMGVTALMEAISKNCPDNVTFLLHHNKGKDFLNLTDFQGTSALSLAVTNRGLDIVREMIDRGAEVNRQDIFGDSPLLQALWDFPSHDIRFVTSLLHAGSDVNHQNNNGISPLMLAASHFTISSMSFRLSSGASLVINYLEQHTSSIQSGLMLRTDVRRLRMALRYWFDNFANSYDLCQKLTAFRPQYERTIVCLLEAGADVNAISKMDSTKTALSFLPSVTYRGEVTIFCMDAFLERFAKSTTVNPVVLQEVILHGAIDVIPKLIQCGLLPAEIKTNKVLLGLYEPDDPNLVSPLCLALLTGNVSLAHYFMGNMFLTSSDVTKLSSNKHVRKVLERKNHQKCLNFFDEMAAHPMSLFKQAFVSVSSAVGTSPGRVNRVELLEIPQILKDGLIFKTRHIERVMTI